jgi:Spy/CpxP family protein refolding chaperone
MKKIGLFLMVTLFAFSNSLFSQNRFIEKKYEKGNEFREERREQMKEQLSPKKRAGHLAVDLELTDVQRDKLEALFEKQDKQREEHQAEMKKLREKQMSKMEEQRKANEAEMEKILGPEKFKALQDKRAERKERFKKNMSIQRQMRENGGFRNDRMERRIEKRIEIRKPEIKVPAN